LHWWRCLLWGQVLVPQHPLQVWRCLLWGQPDARSTALFAGLALSVVGADARTTALFALLALCLLWRQMLVPQHSLQEWRCLLCWQTLEATRQRTLCSWSALCRVGRCHYPRMACNNRGRCCGGTSCASRWHASSWGHPCSSLARPSSWGAQQPCSSLTRPSS
jgi:hypothetical protein